MTIAEPTPDSAPIGGTDRRPRQATVHRVGRLYVRPGNVHGHIVERVTVTAHAQYDCVYLDILGANRALCYELTRQQFRELADVLGDDRDAVDAAGATPDARR